MADESVNDKLETKSCSIYKLDSAFISASSVKIVVNYSHKFGLHLYILLKFVTSDALRHKRTWKWKVHIYVCYLSCHLCIKKCVVFFLLMSFSTLVLYPFCLLPRPTSHAIQKNLHPIKPPFSFINPVFHATNLIPYTDIPFYILLFPI